MLSGPFWAAGTTLCPGVLSNIAEGSVLTNRCGRAAHVSQCQKLWQGQHFATVFKSGESFAKIILFQLKSSFIRQIRRRNMPI